MSAFSPSHLDSPSPAATPAPAPTSLPLSKRTTSSPLSPHATPFYSPSAGRSKHERWMDSPLSPVADRKTAEQCPATRDSYRDAVCRPCAGDQRPRVCDPRPRQLSPPPPLPARTRLRSEIHRVPDAAPDADGWRVVRSKRSRRREAALQRRRGQIPTAMLGRCFNCLEKGHRKAACREPTKCLQCGRPGHRSFECRRPRQAVTVKSTVRAVVAPRRLIPVDLDGRCFNCLSEKHRVADCKLPPRCLRCKQFWHHARDCKRPRPSSSSSSKGTAADRRSMASSSSGAPPGSRDPTPPPPPPPRRPDAQLARFARAAQPPRRAIPPREVPTSSLPVSAAPPPMRRAAGPRGAVSASASLPPEASQDETSGFLSVSVKCATPVPSPVSSPLTMEERVPEAESDRVGPAFDVHRDSKIQNKVSRGSGRQCSASLRIDDGVLATATAAARRKLSLKDPASDFQETQRQCSPYRWEDPMLLELRPCMLAEQPRTVALNAEGNSQEPVRNSTQEACPASAFSDRAEEDPDLAHTVAEPNKEAQLARLSSVAPQARTAVSPGTTCFTAESHESTPRRIQEFIDACQTPLNQPVVATIGSKRPPPIRRPQRRNMSRSSSNMLPRRSKRLAIKDKILPNNSVKRAQRRIMQKLGLIKQDEFPTAETCSAFDDLFRQPLSQRHIIALAELFSRGITSVGLESELIRTQDQQVGA